MPDMTANLHQLAAVIEKIVVEAKQQRKIAPEEELFFQWKVRSFSYGDSGITSSGADGNYITKKMWFKAHIALEKEVEAHAAFKSALAELQQTFPDSSRMNSALETFARKILSICLDDERESGGRRDIEEAVKRFLNDLSGGLITYRAEVELLGITLQPQQISLGPGSRLRQPRQEDLEKTFRPLPMATLTHSLSHPSAILEIQLQSRLGQVAHLQQKVERSIALLRLFDVGSVKWTTHSIRSDSVLDVMDQGTLGSGQQPKLLMFGGV